MVMEGWTERTGAEFRACQGLGFRRVRPLTARKHERTKGGGGGRAPSRRAGLIVGPASADRETTARKLKTTEAPARATAPARPTKTNAPNPPWIRSVPADGAFRGFLSRFRDSVSARPTLTLRPTQGRPAHYRPLSSFRVFVCRCSARPNTRAAIGDKPGQTTCGISSPGLTNLSSSAPYCFS